MTSIRDIAKMAGVSPASVSRILNNDTSFSINKNTRSRVIEIANRMHYSKEKVIRGPKSSGKDMTIGLILRHTHKSELTDPYFLNIHEGIDEEATKWRLRTEIIFTMHDQKKDWDKLANYGAVIIVGEMTIDAINRIKNINPNVILIDATPIVSSCNYIQNDFADKTKDILNYLYKIGHSNIAYIGGKSSIVNMNGQTVYQNQDERLITYINWMKIHHLDNYIKSYITEWSTQAGLESANKLLKSKKLPSAVLVGSDPMALGVYKAFNNHHIRIPEDISVVSFDDLELSKYLTPSLSSVYLDSSEMGKTAVRLAKDMIIEKGTNTFAITITCHSKFNIRDSISKK